MSRAPKVTGKCKHPKLDKDLRCKDCGEKVDIREKRNKYGNRRTNGFQSAKEARRYQVLKADPRVLILQTQVNYPLEVKGVLICSYRADFVYLFVETPQTPTRQIVEDAKPRSQGFKATDAYRIFQIKKRLMKACHGIEVVEI